jgi:hypothetical protein
LVEDHGQEEGEVEVTLSHEPVGLLIGGELHDAPPKRSVRPFLEGDQLPNHRSLGRFVDWFEEWTGCEGRTLDRSIGVRPVRGMRPIG